MVGRPDDASGEAFRVVLAHIREIRPRSAARIRRGRLTVAWEHKAGSLHCPAVREATAVVGDYFLYAVEMRDAFLGQNADARMPKINWALMQPGDDGEALAGAPAPTFEEAMVRAEAAIRVFFGQALDG